MTTKNAIGAIAVAALLVLAGCSTAVPGTTTGAQATTDDTGSMDASDSADLTFYVSDRPGAIEDFEHLNVTITKIGLHEAGGDDGADDAESANETTDADEDSEGSASANDTTEADANADLGDVETTTVDDPNETTVEMNDTDTETDDSEETEEPEETEETEEPEETEDSEETDESDDESKDEDAEGDESSEKDGWVMHDVDNATVDLTKLQAANATAISNVSVPAGEYDKVFVYVSDINATLTNGESVNVKLPSQKLQLNKNFELSANSSPDFVFDINVHKAGNSGKYILRPIVSESGTGDQVEIEKVDKNGKPENPGNSGAKGKDKADDGEDDGDDESNESESETESALEATLDGKVRAGETVTLSVTDANGSVANATVAVNGETVGETGTDGTLAFEVPDTEELAVKVTAGDAEVELERKVKGGNGGGNGNGNGNGQLVGGYAVV
ncbi:DUF4382 domain-containing protein [Halorubellus sp. PRR65]|uniref:DUF4382 domain-containing protein n=1 Tax=Halorubellus sp. PRR65 TaxID=3098148 RepID=UPI002B2574D1|nr:DUF4382 domain-containing protein [Halorubellus sp. PRR65]